MLATVATTLVAPPLPDAAHLPDEPALLKQMIAELLTTLHGRDRECAQLRHRLDQLLRRLYGPRAERFDPNQPTLFGEPEATPPPPAPVPLPSPPAARKATPHGRRVLPKNLRRERQVYELSAAERCCPDCGQERRRCGEERSEQLDYQPASLFVVEHVRVKYACARCQEHVAVAAKPAQPIDKGLPGPGLLAHLVVCKYDDHLPLHRLERIFARQGVLLNRSTTCSWLAACAALLRPLYDLMTTRLLGSRVLHTDDTTTPVLDDSRDTTRQGHLWVYLGDRDRPYTVFDFTPNHSRDGPTHFLRHYTGYLQADAWPGYDPLYTDQRGVITEVGCWAHARRYFYEARGSDPQRSHQTLARIRQLYDVEDQATAQCTRQQWTGDAADALRRQLRQEQALPLLTAFQAWLVEQQRQVLPKSPMGQAVGYALAHWAALLRYTEAGYLAIDNNAAERALRHVVTGRKNWLFCGSDAGGDRAAVLFSVTGSCRRLGLDPFAYLRDVLRRLPTHPVTRLDELLPDHWQQAQAAPPAP
jgi:transposase